MALMRAASRVAKRGSPAARSAVAGSPFAAVAAAWFASSAPGTATAAGHAKTLTDLDDPVEYFHPKKEHGAAMHRIVSEGSLDDNSPYAYILYSHYYSDTCLVAKHKKTGQVLGFVMGFRPPKNPEQLFVWQVGADESARGLGLASRMILELAHSQADAGVKYITATVTPTNAASQALFHGLGKKLECGVDVRRNLIRVTDFPVDALHEAEDLYVVGPFTKQGAAGALDGVQQKQRQRAQGGGGMDAAGAEAANQHGR